MKSVLFLTTLLVSGSLYANETCTPSCTDSVSDADKKCVMSKMCGPKLSKKDREIKKLKQQLADLEAKNQKLESELASKSAPRVIYVLNNKEETSQNSVSLLIPYSATKLEATRIGNTYKAETKHELDLGLMYQRDSDDGVRGTIGATLNGTALLGLGLNF